MRACTSCDSGVYVCVRVYVFVHTVVRHVCGACICLLVCACVCVCACMCVCGWVGVCVCGGYTDMTSHDEIDKVDF